MCAQVWVWRLADTLGGAGIVYQIIKPLIDSQLKTIQQWDAVDDPTMVGLKMLRQSVKLGCAGLAEACCGYLGVPLGGQHATELFVSACAKPDLYVEFAAELSDLVPTREAFAAVLREGLLRISAAGRADALDKLVSMRVVHRALSHCGSLTCEMDNDWLVEEARELHALAGHQSDRSSIKKFLDQTLLLARKHASALQDQLATSVQEEASQRALGVLESLIRRFDSDGDRAKRARLD